MSYGCRRCWDTGSCPHCEAVPVAAVHAQVELEGLRALARAVERFGDPVVARMARNALEGRYPETDRRAA